MAEAHAAVGSVLLGAAILFTLTAGIAVAVGGAPWVEWARVAMTTLIGVQVTLGVVAFSDGAPRDALHVVYGLVALGLLPFASFFASEAPAKARAGVFVVAGAVLAGVLWRSTVTA